MVLKVMQGWAGGLGEESGWEELGLGMSVERLFSLNITSSSAN